MADYSRPIADPDIRPGRVMQLPETDARESSSGPSLREVVGELMNYTDTLHEKVSKTEERLQVVLLQGESEKMLDMKLPGAEFPGISPLTRDAINLHANLRELGRRIDRLIARVNL